MPPLRTLSPQACLSRQNQSAGVPCRYVVGLEKLQASAAAVANMQDELTALQPQLVKTVGEVEELMVRIGKEKAEVVEPKAEVRSPSQC